MAVENKMKDNKLTQQGFFFSKTITSKNPDYITIPEHLKIFQHFQQPSHFLNQNKM